MNAGDQVYGPLSGRGLLPAIGMKPEDPRFNELGFQSEDEFHRLVTRLQLKSTAMITLFCRWRDHDGTRVGLTALYDVSGQEVPYL